MAKTGKVLDINVNGIRVVCVKNYETKHNPYTIKQMIWCDGVRHSKTLEKYQDFPSVISWLNDKRFSFGE